MNEAEKFLDELPAKFDDIYFSIFEYKVEVTEDIALPEFKGSVFHGAFGSAFKKVVCINKSEKQCTDCIVNKDCSYFYIFESSIDKNTLEKLKITSTSPRPYVFEPPGSEETEYKKGDTFKFNLILIGNAVYYRDYFKLVFSELGKSGIGKHINGIRGKYKILEINNISVNSSDSTNQYDKINESKLIEVPQKAEEIQIEFITPVRIEVKKKPQLLDENSGFTVFILRLYGRLHYLQQIYCREGNATVFSNQEIEKLSRNIKTEISDITLIDMQRKKYAYKNEPGKKIKMKYGGFTGRVIFRGYLTPYLKMIKLGEYLHIGKYYTFGFGKYKILSIK